MRGRLSSLDLLVNLQRRYPTADARATLLSYSPSNVFDMLNV